MPSQGFNNTGFNVYTNAPEVLAYNINSNGILTQPTQPIFSGSLNLESNATGDGTVFHPGSIAAVTVISNVTGSFNPGNGAGTGCSFTAPTTGVYLFSFSIIWATPIAGGNTVVTQVVTTSYTYTISNLPTQNLVPSFLGSNNFITDGAQALAFMTSGDTAQFTITIAGGAKTSEIAGGFVSGCLLA